MNKLILGVLLAVSYQALPGRSAHALENTQPFIATVASTMTTLGVSITSAPAFNVIISTNWGYRQVCVQNLDTTYSLACGDNILVSTLTTHALMGTVIPPAVSTTTAVTPTCFSVVAYNPYYCRTTSRSGSTRASVTRAR